MHDTDLFRWIFEEIVAQQHLDKSSTERLDMLKDYSTFGLEYWGADEMGLISIVRLPFGNDNIRREQNAALPL